MNKYFTGGAVIALICYASLSLAQKYQAIPEQRLAVRVSKTGLNRISNDPYKIVQVTGDDSRFRLKSDEDGQNIYLIPLANIGEKIELSIRNNVGFVQDLELEVASIKGQSIQIDSINNSNLSKKTEQQTLSQMLRAMRYGQVEKFYVQNTKNILGKIDNLNVIQTKLYKWQDLAGGVFAVTNNTRKEQSLNVAQFLQRFDNVLTSFVTAENLLPKQTAHIFIIQKNKG